MKRKLTARAIAIGVIEELCGNQKKKLALAVDD